MSIKKVKIIAEAGVNHNADFNRAIKMIEIAKECGADIIKFQTAVPELVMTKGATMADYQIANTGKKESQIEMAKKLHLPLDAFKQLKEYCQKIEIEFLSTPFDFKSIDYLHALGMKTFKIPSGEITNLPYLRKIGSFKNEVILSTGMATLGEIEAAIDILIKAGTKKENITVLHCNTEYPTPFEDVNLLSMKTISKAFGVKVGYSDHTKGIEVPIAAVSLGAEIIEKHFTLDRNLPGPDHKASLDPKELKEMVLAIRNIEKALGNGIKKPSASETKNIVIARKSIVAKTKIKKGELFTEDNLTTKRPGNGLSPMLWDNIIGTTAKKDFYEDEQIVL